MISEEESKIAVVTLEPLTDQSFAPFGDVIGTLYKISRFDLGGGNLHMNFVTRPYQEFKFDSMERHFGRQGFIPMDSNPFAVVVAGTSPDGFPDMNSLKAFSVGGSKAVVLHEGIWHAHDRFPLAPPESKMIVFCSVKMEEPSQTQKVNLKEKYGIVGKISV